MYPSYNFPYSFFPLKEKFSFYFVLTVYQFLHLHSWTSFFFFLIEVWLLYNVVLVSAVQQNESYAYHL